VEAALAAQLGVSRGTIRAALSLPPMKSWCCRSPTRNGWCPALSAEDAWELYTLRGSLEGLAAKLAAERQTSDTRKLLVEAYDRLAKAVSTGKHAPVAEADLGLHKTIVAMTGHHRLIAQYKLLEQQVRHYIVTSNSQIVDLHAILDEHQPMVKAIATGDAAKAERLAREHNAPEVRRFADELADAAAERRAAAAGAAETRRRASGNGVWATSTTNYLTKPREAIMIRTSNRKRNLTAYVPGGWRRRHRRRPPFCATAAPRRRRWISAGSRGMAVQGARAFRQSWTNPPPAPSDVQLYFNGTLFAQGTEIEAMQRGNLECALTSPQDITNFIPEYSIFTTGYLMRDPAHLDAVYDGEVGEEYKARVSKDVGLHIVRSQYLGTRHVILREPREVKTPADMAGLKLRMPGSETWQFLGNSLAPMRRRWLSRRSIWRCRPAPSTGWRIRCRTRWRQSSMKCRSRWC
jgi:DNA-binding GntR family transcriptional regulator